jgi:hypothetical protein
MTWSERMFERLRDLELSHDQIVSVMEILVEAREAADYAGYKRGMEAAIEQEEVVPAESTCKPFVCLCPVCRSWA